MYILKDSRKNRNKKSAREENFYKRWNRTDGGADIEHNCFFCIHGCNAWSWPLCIYECRHDTDNIVFFN